MARRKIPDDFEKMDKPGRLVELRKGDIRIPQEYQRVVDRAHVRRIARDFDWFLFGVIIVAYRNGEYFVVDGQHRLLAVMERPEIDLVPAMLYDFNGPEHEAQTFIDQQLKRKGIITRDLHRAQLFIGEPTAAKAQALSECLKSGNVPLATLRALYKRKPEAMERIEAMLPDFVGEAPARKDFLEAAAYLEDELGADQSLATIWRTKLEAMGYECVLLGILHHLKAHEHERISKTASPAAKAAALRWTLGLDGGPGFDCPIKSDLFGPRQFERTEIRDADGNHIADQIS